MDGRHVHRQRHLVVDEVGVERAPGAHVDLVVLIQRMADALLDAAFDLPRGRDRVDHLADVMHWHHLLHGDEAGFGIDRHLDKMRGE